MKDYSLLKYASYNMYILMTEISVPLCYVEQNNKYKGFGQNQNN